MRAKRRELLQIVRQAGSRDRPAECGWVIVGQRGQQDHRAPAFLEPQRAFVAIDRLRAKLVGLLMRPGSEFAGVHGSEPYARQDP
jgi:hypothetical protein